MFIVILSWIFGREFADGTVKDMLAVPVPRSTIVLAKFVIFGAWAFAMTLLILVTGILMGLLVQLPIAEFILIGRGIVLVLLTALLVLLVVVPFALIASFGHGYLLPLSLAVVTLLLANIAIALGWGDLFPWSIPGLFSQNTNQVGVTGYWVVAATGLLGMWGTDLWWRKADQNK
jgi:ABC-2 type transport system permease protein